MTTSRKSKILALSFGKALTGVVTLASFSALSYLLTEKKDYAAFRQTIMAFMIVTPFMTMGLKHGLFYFLPVEEKRTRGRVIDSLLIVLSTGSIFGIFIYFGGNKILAERFSNPQVAGLLLLLIPMCFAHAITQLIAPILTILDRIYPLTIFNVVSRLFIGVMTICPVLVWVNPSSALIGKMIGAIIVSLVGLALIFRFLPRDNWKPSASAIKEIGIFSIPLGFGTMIGALNLQLDKLVVSSMCSPDEFAVFANGAIEIPLIGVLTGSIVAVLMVEMRKAVAESRQTEALDLFRSIAVKTSYVLFPIAIFLFVYAEPFVTTLFSAAYSESAVPLKIYLLLIPIRTVSFGALLVALGLNNVILFRSLVSLLLNLVLSIVFVYLFGPIGAAVATVSVVLVWAVPCSVFFISRATESSWWRVLPLRHFLKVVLQLIFFGAVLILLALLTTRLPAVLQLLLGTTVAAIWMVIWWNGKLYNLKSMLKRLRTS